MKMRRFAMPGALLGLMFSMLLTSPVGAHTDGSLDRQASTALREARQRSGLDRAPEFARGAYAPNLWPGGIVPFEFDASVNAANQLNMTNAMAEIEAVCALDFVPRNGEADYLVIKSGDVNESLVGRVGGSQDLTIRDWSFRWVIVHELMHAIGVFDEHLRSDRDQFVTVNTDNVQADRLGDFQIVPVAILVGDYDLESVMHGDECLHSTCCPADFVCNCPMNCTTIMVLPPNEGLQGTIGQRAGFSPGDEALLFEIYPPNDCNNNGVPDDTEPFDIVYVDASAPAGGDGFAWATAYTSLTDALDVVACNPQLVNEIRVAQGTYLPASATTDRTATFNLVGGVPLRGGYAGLAGVDPDARDRELFPTILTGDALNNDLPQFVNRSDNVYHVVSSTDQKDAELEGFIIRSGNADDTSENRQFGGGLFVDLGSARIADCRFTDNAGIFGGAAFFSEATVTVEDCHFDFNTADQNGAAFFAILCEMGVNRTTADNHEVDGGYAIAHQECTADIYSSFISRNNGGGLWFLNTTAIVAGCSINGNTENGVLSGISTVIDYINCTISNNAAGSLTISGAPDFTNCIVYGNTTAQFVGGVNSVTFSNVEGGFAGSGNIDMDPMFVDNDGRLALLTPVKDQGNDAALPDDVFDADDDGITSEPLSRDLDGNPRINGAAVEMGAFELPPPPPSENVNCADAIIITDGPTVFDNSTAGSTAILEPCGNLAGDLWYRYSASFLGTLDVSVCDASFDTILAVYGAACPTGNNESLICNDDSCGTGSSISLAVTPGEYLIRVGTSVGDGGVGTLVVSCTPLPDCNNNGIDDADDIAGGTSDDCNANTVPDECEFTAAAQFASAVLAVSSEFNPTGDYAAEQVLGPPTATTYGDSPQAWSPTSQNGTEEFVSVMFPTPVYANGAIVHENWGTGSVTQLEVIDLNDISHIVWIGDDPGVPGMINAFEVHWPQTTFLVKGLTVRTDTDATTDWEEIDAIELLGSVNLEGDCNGNGIDDACDIADETAADCNANGIPDVCEMTAFDQRATTVIDFSSQFSAGDYAAAAALGEPDVFAYGDSPNAWSADTRDGTLEFLTFGYTTPVYANAVIIRESWGAGSVYQVDLIDSLGGSHTVFFGDDPSQPGVVNDFLISFPTTPYLVTGVRIRIDTDATADWEEIDAVTLRGSLASDGDCDGNGIPDACDVSITANDCNNNGVPDVCEVGRLDQWASEVVTFSTQFGAPGYAAAQALGGPDVFTYGDSTSAWTPFFMNGTTEFITVGFDHAALADGVTIRESWGAGCVTRVDLIDQFNQVSTVFDGVDPNPEGAIVDFFISFPRTTIPITGVKVFTDTDATTDWEEIDAIMLHGLPANSVDLDEDGEPDDCDEIVCPEDCSPDNGDGTFGNGVINIDDLLSVVKVFGQTGDSPCDVSPDNGDGTFGNGIINIDDLLAVVSAFGPCE